MLIAIDSIMVGVVGVLSNCSLIPNATEVVVFYSKELAPYDKMRSYGIINEFFAGLNGFGQDVYHVNAKSRWLLWPTAARFGPTEAYVAAEMGADPDLFEAFVEDAQHASAYPIVYSQSILGMPTTMQANRRVIGIIHDHFGSYVAWPPTTPPYAMDQSGALGTPCNPQFSFTGEPNQNFMDDYAAHADLNVDNHFLAFVAQKYGEEIWWNMNGPHSSINYNWVVYHTILGMVASNVALPYAPVPPITDIAWCDTNTIELEVLETENPYHDNQVAGLINKNVELDVRLTKIDAERLGAFFGLEEGPCAPPPFPEASPPPRPPPPCPPPPLPEASSPSPPPLPDFTASKCVRDTCHKGQTYRIFHNNTVYVASKCVTLPILPPHPSFCMCAALTANGELLLPLVELAPLSNPDVFSGVTSGYVSPEQLPVPSILELRVLDRR